MDRTCRIHGECDMLPTYWHKNMEGKDNEGDIQGAAEITPTF